MSETTGFIDFHYQGETYQTWYKVTGDLNQVQAGCRPLIVLHGGPGISHDYVAGHGDLYASHNIPVICYDQLGIGRSTHLKEKGVDFWTFELFMDELDNVLNHFNISDNFDLLGHSWGGFLIGCYAARRKRPGLKSLVLANTAASMELWDVGRDNLVDLLPEETRSVIRKHEKDGTTDSDEYKNAIKRFNQKHICKLDPWPAEFTASFDAKRADPTVSKAMNGPSGALKGWSCVDELASITARALIVNSPEDIAQDVGNYPFFRSIQHVKWVHLVGSTHVPFLEDPEKYFKFVGDFLVSAT